MAASSQSVGYVDRICSSIFPHDCAPCDVLPHHRNDPTSPTISILSFLIPRSGYFAQRIEMPAERRSVGVPQLLVTKTLFHKIMISPFLPLGHVQGKSKITIV